MRLLGHLSPSLLLPLPSAPLLLHTLVFRQSERSELYSLCADKLLKERMAYRCFFTKEVLEAMKEKQESEVIPHATTVPDMTQTKN